MPERRTQDYVRDGLTALSAAFGPRPFIWTKTAEQILDSLARFCQQISCARH
ncbi:hypothetical protein GCM10010245_91660 [Streptomyces spectabilis]|nr:hypothetical protein GCM10010245_91660 [Streptomyces spectabilis]